MLHNQRKKGCVVSFSPKGRKPDKSKNCGTRLINASTSRWHTASWAWFLVLALPFWRRTQYGSGSVTNNVILQWDSTQKCFSENILGKAVTEPWFIYSLIWVWSTPHVHGELKTKTQKVICILYNSPSFDMSDVLRNIPDTMFLASTFTVGSLRWMPRLHARTHHLNEGRPVGPGGFCRRVFTCYLAASLTP